MATQKTCTAKGCASAKKSGVSNYRIYTDLKLNPGNLNAWLKHGDSSKVSLYTARKTLQYMENY